ncbi:hypothetical protein [Vibrio phage RYC]|nr:hypothetical protein [Vibrio phage RYC]
MSKKIKLELLEQGTRFDYAGRTLRLCQESSSHEGLFYCYDEERNECRKLAYSTLVEVVQSDAISYVSKQVGKLHTLLDHFEEGLDKMQEKVSKR